MMKNIICIFMFMLLLTGLTNAEYSSEKLKKGIRLGFNQSTVTNADFDVKNYTGYCIGGFLNYQSSEYFSLQMELLYNGKGYRQENVISRDSNGVAVGTIDEVTTILSYIEIPIIAKITAIPNGKYRPYVLGGGFIGLLVQDKLRLSNSAPFLDVDIENSKSSDVGFLFGGGIDLKAGEKTWMFFEVRYEISLISPIQNVDYKSRSLGFQTGLWF
ncbi:MAG: PorT family protein [candidate division Zixibacteria bacterium]|nr:PorT family protein [candidate division Zixibacteria bacterium]